jgi:amphi-Trp domain-containing protein
MTRDERSLGLMAALKGRNVALSPVPQHVESEMSKTAARESTERDIEKDYPLKDFASKLRRLADAIEAGEQYEIQVAGERIYVPVRARYNIEHERGLDGEELEFQIKWK